MPGNLQVHPSAGSPTTSTPTIGGSTGGAGRRAIEHHYDVSREFYELWLDRRRVYSCGFWPGALDDDLDAAQTAKLAWHVDAASAEGKGRVLDVGCGWGALLGYLTAERHVGHATGLTLSSDQADAARAVGGPVEVRLEDWRDHQPEEPYDAIISIGALEHFARWDLDAPARLAVYRDFFERCASWLPPGGRLSLQTIAYEDFDPSAAGPVSTFYSEDIFPESSLPRLGDIVEASRDFRVLALRSDAAHYEQTLHLWQKRLQAQEQAALALVGRDVYRRYLRYLRVSRAMFDRGVCTLYRIVMERRPLTGVGR